jgi:hypothetical protein
MDSSDHVRLQLTYCKGRRAYGAHCHPFFLWHNTQHHHSGLGLLTPSDVRHGLAEHRIAARATVLATAYAAHPLPHRPAPPACVSHGSVDQSTQNPSARVGVDINSLRPGDP